MTDVAVLGAGNWGTTLADLLARKGLQVKLWAFEPEVAASITARHENDLYMPGEALAPTLVASNDLAEVVRDAPVICSAVPSHASRGVLGRISGDIARATRFISATKGIETDTLKFMGDVVADVLPQVTFVALSGPSFAEEVLHGQPTAVVAASLDRAAAAETQRLFSTPTFRLYTNSDVIGVTLAGSLKNTIAIAAGILEGLGMGNNARAALLTRGLAEMSRLGTALGAAESTFAGLAGMGDLILTCTGSLSRNRQLGIALAQGETLAEYQARHRTVIEGVNTALAATQLAARHGVEMPITAQVAAVLFEDASPAESIQTLMGRAQRAEQWG